MHRLVLKVKSHFIDHKDGDGLNNQKSNLRLCNRFQNGQNRKVQKHSSPYKGVTWFEPAKSFQVKIQINGTRKFLGYVKDPTEGAKIYDAAAIRYFGSFARTNQHIEVTHAL
jgi:hypothetical protein